MKELLSARYLFLKPISIVCVMIAVSMGTSSAQTWPLGPHSLEVYDRPIGSVLETFQSNYQGSPDYYAGDHSISRHTTLDKLYYPEGDSLKLLSYRQTIRYTDNFFNPYVLNITTYYEDSIWSSYKNLSYPINQDSAALFSPLSLLFEPELLIESPIEFIYSESEIAGNPAIIVNWRAECQEFMYEDQLNILAQYILGVGKFGGYSYFSCFKNNFSSQVELTNFDMDGLNLQNFHEEFDDLQNLPTKAEVFNYEIGDEFIFNHFDSASGDYIVTQKTIINYQANQDSIWYEYLLREIIINNHIIISDESIVKNRVVYDPWRYYFDEKNGVINSNIIQIPNGIVPDYYPNTNSSSWVIRGNSICNSLERVVIDLGKKVYVTGPSNENEYIRSDMMEAILGVGISITTFPNISTYRNTEKEWYGNLVYAKKSYAECGISIDSLIEWLISGTEENDYQRFEEFISIQTNSDMNRIIVTFDGHLENIYEAKLFDIYGREICKSNKPGQYMELLYGDLLSGIYFISIIDGLGNSFNKSIFLQ